MRETKKQFEALTAARSLKGMVFSEAPTGTHGQSTPVHKQDWFNRDATAEHGMQNCQP